MVRAPALPRSRAVQRHAGERRVAWIAAEKRRQRRVGVDHAVAERRGDGEPGAVAPGRGDGQAAGREDHARGGDGSARRGEAEARGAGCDRGHAGAELQPDTARPRERHQPVAHVARPIRLREQLAGFLFERQRNVQVVLEKRALLVERPRLQHAAHQVRRRVGDEAFGRQDRGQDVAAAAAADEDFVRRRACVR